MQDENKQEELVSTELTLAEQEQKNRELLKQESAELLKKISTEVDVEKAKDLTYLFNLNHNKKAMLRQDKLNDLMDTLVDNATDRWTNHPDEIDNETLIRAMTTVQGIMEKNAATATSNPEPKQLIQVQHNEVNINSTEPSKPELTREQRKNVDSVISKILQNALGRSGIDPADAPTESAPVDTDDVIDADFEELANDKK